MKGLFAFTCTQDVHTCSLYELQTPLYFIYIRFISYKSMILDLVRLKLYRQIQLKVMFPADQGNVAVMTVEL